MTPAFRDKAIQWYSLCEYSSYYATSVCFRWTFSDGQVGVAYACSTGASTRLSAINAKAYERGEVVTHPSWMEYEVWYFPGASLLNLVARLKHPYHRIGTLGEVFDHAFAARQVSKKDWIRKYCIADGGRHRDGMRAALQANGVSLWLEITSRRSWLAMGCLDMYIRIHSNLQAPDDEEAHFLLNTNVGIEHRGLPTIL